MDFSNKIDNLKKGYSKFAERIKKASLSDFWKAYHRFLKRVPDIIHLKNIVLFGLIGSLAILILFGQRFRNLAEYFPKEPAQGGIYKEGIVGEIKQLNPLFSPVNSAEEAATKMIFSGLTKKNNNRKVIPDLAKSWEVSADGKVYTFILNDNLRWHDGEPLTADDVIFSIETIQNPDTKSPLLAIWKGVEVKKEAKNKIIFVLKTPYTDFISKTDFAILPKHILAEIPARSMVSSEFNQAPIGSGPFSFFEMKNIKDSQELTLIANDAYYSGAPFLDKVILKTYSSQNSLTRAYSRREVLGIERIPQGSSEDKKLPNIHPYHLSIPEYNMVYFNLRNDVLKDAAVRQAISLSVSRQEIIDDVFEGEANLIYAPIVSGYLGNSPKFKTGQNIALAKEKLTAAGYSQNSEGMFSKNGALLILRLVVQENSESAKIAEVLKSNLASAGIGLEIEKYRFSVFVQDHIRPRDFDMILITQNLGSDSDLYSFWHSSGVNDPGLNLSGLNDRRLDKFLEQGRTMVGVDPAARSQKYLEVLEVINENNGAIFLTWPHYNYGVSKEVKGITEGRFVDPKDRFWNIQDWYINTKSSMILS